MKYYQDEHESAYRRIAREGLTQWNDLFEGDDAGSYEDFSNRPFLERAIPSLSLSPAATHILEYGCGTGPAACFLAAQGFQVDAIDLIPQAIELARGFARERGLRIDFAVQDICDLASVPTARQYDVVVDSFCLQSIVTDADRAAVFAAVHTRLKPGGCYLISTAMYDPARIYDTDLYDKNTGICYQRGSGDGAIRIDGAWYRPHRRHLTPIMLRRELTNSGLHIIAQEGTLGGDIIATRLGNSA